MRNIKIITSGNEERVYISDKAKEKAYDEIDNLRYAAEEVGDVVNSVLINFNELNNTQFTLELIIKTQRDTFKREVKGEEFSEMVARASGEIEKAFFEKNQKRIDKKRNRNKKSKRKYENKYYDEYELEDL